MRPDCVGRRAGRSHKMNQAARQSSEADRTMATAVEEGAAALDRAAPQHNVQIQGGGDRAQRQNKNDDYRSHDRLFGLLAGIASKNGPNGVWAFRWSRLTKRVSTCPAGKQLEPTCNRVSARRPTECTNRSFNYGCEEPRYPAWLSDLRVALMIVLYLALALLCGFAAGFLVCWLRKIDDR